MKHIPDYRQFVNEAVNLKAAHLSSAEYQKAKKLKAFDSADWTWNPKSQLYDKVNESLVTEAKFFRLPNKLNAMWELKNSVDYIVGKHSNGDDYNPAEMKTIEEFIKKIKKSAKAFKDSEEVKGTIYESVITEKLARGLKPLLTIGSTITKKAGEDALLDLSDKFDAINNDFPIASHLDMAIELMQDGYPGDATKKLKQFNKACKDVLKGKEIGSAFESTVTEAKRAGLSKKETLKVAQKFAAALTKLDGKKYTVSKDYEEDSFDLDIDGDEYAGGSYNINDDGSVVNMATWNRKTNVSPTYGNMNDDIKTIIKTIKNIKESVNESAMSELDLLAKEAKDFKSFTKEVFKEFKNLPKKADTLKWLEELYNDAINEAEKAEGDRSKLSAEIEKALKDKATESGVPIGLLRLVMRRGLDAWNSSHREGVPQVAWGYARVNAFLEKGKGTWGKADADIAKEVRDEGKAGKLPIKNPSEFTKKEREA